MAQWQNNLEIILTRFGSLETESDKEEYIESLEEFISKCNSYLNDTGDALVPDSVYDTCVDYLREMKPDSALLHSVWSEDDTSVPFDEDLDMFLSTHPLMSIQTIKNTADKYLKEFISKLPLFDVEFCVSVKLNGHAVRVVYNNGVLVKATSRGRSTNGKDLTNQMKLILGEKNDLLADNGIVELRGEVLLPFSNLAKAREYNPAIKSAFSGVSSMIRASATEEESQLLSVVFYDILGIGIPFEKLTEKYDCLEQLGYETPLYSLTYASRNTLLQELDNTLKNMDISTTDYDYHLDGLVFAINDISLFTEFGSDSRVRLGNLALKMGRWKQDGYIGIVDHIEWFNGKTKKTPVAILQEGVLTATGNTVTNVPLYAPLYILMLEAYPGNPIHFKYGGESGVIPTLQDGRLVTDIK